MTSLSTSFTESTYILTQTTPNRTLCLPPIPPRFLYIAGKSLQLRLRSRPHAITRTKTAPPELLSSLPGLSGAHEGKQWPGVLAVAGFRRRRWVLGLESLREDQAQSSAVCDELFTRPLRSAPSLFTHLFSFFSRSPSTAYFSALPSLNEWGRRPSGFFEFNSTGTVHSPC